MFSPVPSKFPYIHIAIDGYSGCGKSTTAKGVAKLLGYLYIDSGAMYRAVTLYLLRHQIPFDTENEQLKAALDDIHLDFVLSEQTGLPEITLNGEAVEHEIRTPEVASKVSPVSVHPSVRRLMVAQQQRISENCGVVMDGRDIGTVVFPDAELKIFMTADIQLRALRRKAELEEKGIAADMTEILQNLSERDRIDTSRAESPLRKAADAVVLDTSHTTIEEQIQFVYRLALERIGAKKEVCSPLEG